MRIAAFSLLSTLASVAFATGHSDGGHSNAFAVHRVLRRQSGIDIEEAFLPLVVGSATPACQSGCTMVNRHIAQCLVNQGGDLGVATCACSNRTLDIINSCATCIHHDTANVQGQLAINSYNSYVNQCIYLGLTDESSLYSDETVVATAIHVHSAIAPSATQYIPMGTPLFTPPAQGPKHAAAGTVRVGLGGLLSGVLLMGWFII